MTEIGEYFVNKCLEATTIKDPWPYTQFADGLPADSFNKLKTSIKNIDEERLIVEQTKDSNKKAFTLDDFPTLKEFNDVNSKWRQRHLPSDDPNESRGGQFGQWVKRIHTKRNGLYPTYLYPEQWKEYDIDFEDEMRSIGKAVLDNARDLCNKFPKYKWYHKLGLNVHIKVDPPRPFSYYVHADSPDKVWTSVIYISPDENIGTQLYTGKLGDKSIEEEDYTLIKELPWKPNNHFVFCSDYERSYHNYRNSTPTNRYTLCMFIGKFKENAGYYYNN